MRYLLQAPISAGSGSRFWGRPALDHIGDIDLLPIQADGGEELFQELAGRANEGTALAVFLGAGAFADEHQLGVGRALAGDGTGAAPMEVALGTAGDQLRNLFQAIHNRLQEPQRSRGVG